MTHEENRAVDMLSDEEREVMVSCYRAGVAEQCVVATFVLAACGRGKACWHWREAARLTRVLSELGEMVTGVWQ